MSAPLKAVKLRNQLHKINPDLKVSVKNTRINADTVGCSGFVTDPATGRIVYVDTEESCVGLGLLYRTAAHTRDYTGGRNRFTTAADLAESVVELLNDSSAWS